MGRIILSSAACLTIEYVSTLNVTRISGGKKITEDKMCVLIFYFFISNISHSKKNPARYYHKCKYVFM